MKFAPALPLAQPSLPEPVGSAASTTANIDISMAPLGLHGLLTLQATQSQLPAEPLFRLEHSELVNLPPDVCLPTLL